jgi:hypothetical protein
LEKQALEKKTEENNTESKMSLSLENLEIILDVHEHIYGSIAVESYK